jgi:hypothetical protein
LLKKALNKRLKEHKDRYIPLEDYGSINIQFSERQIIRIKEIREEDIVPYHEQELDF